MNDFWVETNFDPTWDVRKMRRDMDEAEQLAKLTASIDRCLEQFEIEMGYGSTTLTKAEIAEMVGIDDLPDEPLRKSLSIVHDDLAQRARRLYTNEVKKTSSVPDGMRATWAMYKQYATPEQTRAVDAAIKHFDTGVFLANLRQCMATQRRNEVR